MGQEMAPCENPRNQTQESLPSRFPDSVEGTTLTGLSVAPTRSVVENMIFFYVFLILTFFQILASCNIVGTSFSRNMTSLYIIYFPFCFKRAFSKNFIRVVTSF